MITFRNLGGAVAVGAALLAGTSGLALAQADKNTVVIAYPTDPASLDPIQVTQGPGMPMMRALFDQPLEQKDDLSIGPRIGRRSWPTTSSVPPIATASSRLSIARWSGVRGMDA